MKKILLLITVFGIALISGCGKDEEGLTEEEQLALDLEIIDSHLSANGITAQEHESGIRYVVDREGDGESPTASGNVIVKYKGTFLNGEIFDRNDLGVNFNLGALIEAWALMIPEMKEGGKMTMYVPSKYAYGSRGSGPIPPNTVLIFEMELVSLVRSASEQLEIDLARIDQHLEGNNINAQIHSSGIRYRVLEEGTGLNPTLTDLVTVTYTGQFLEGEIFDEAENVDFRLNSLIDSWKTMLPTMQEGGRIIMYAPSGMCYGNEGNGINIPPNAVLIFQIELIEINK
ncbi:FKBP-type peptidyl-prolyl cis-trans isomerase [Ekhidna lutea]|uniref:Peptidyl-prolyl cis-trans isomerase n=1 Tax=Ekhidna lutea TaxID=447679 RepID=A0A239LKW8_EKHLU|nr:FKBP-type peptidyl-prolyl cis-trans isomerase [Ekhidna lutea]SNT31317.1 FKBP-type peptidyl-prolyl cis-trans isomerase [Ekhidna lutea]